MLQTEFYHMKFVLLFWVIHSLVLDFTLHTCLELGSLTLTGPAFRDHCKVSLRGCALVMLVSSLLWGQIGQIQVSRVQGRALGSEVSEALCTVWAVKDQVLWQEPRFLSKRVMWLVGKVWDSKKVLQITWETGMEMLAAGFGQNHVTTWSGFLLHEVNHSMLATCRCAGLRGLGPSDGYDEL